MALELDAAVAHDVAREQAHDRAREHRLAGARLAHDAERLAPLERERDTVDRAHEPALGLEVRLDLVDLEQRPVERGVVRTIGALLRCAAGSQRALPHVEPRTHDVTEVVERRAP